MKAYRVQCTSSVTYQQIITATLQRPLAPPQRTTSADHPQFNSDNLGYLPWTTTSAVFALVAAGSLFRGMLKYRNILAGKKAPLPASVHPPYALLTPPPPEYVSHSVYRCQVFFQSPESGPPHPLTHKEILLLPPLGPRGKTHTRLRRRGWGGPITTKEQTLWCSV
jgi:hypothetical protein